MMADMLRVVAKLSPALFEAASVHLVETSERLQKVQQQTLVAHKFKISSGTTASTLCRTVFCFWPPTNCSTPSPSASSSRRRTGFRERHCRP
jgi:hypothetical protein